MTGKPFLPEDEPVCFSPTDRITLGHGVFDTLLVRDGHPVHGPAHMDRLLHHAQLFGITPPDNMTRETLLTRIMNRVSVHSAQSGLWRLRTILSAGEGPPGLTPPSQLSPTLSITLIPLPDPQTLPPLTLVTARTVTRNDRSPLSRIKSTNYGDSILAAAEARSRGAVDALLLNTRERIACVCAGNFFALLPDGQLVTPPCQDGAMDGIIRERLLSRGARERPLTLADLDTAHALYVSNSLVGLRPVTRFENRTFQTIIDLSDRFDLS